ncbi:MAG: sulfurtransferase TusA family protein [Nitrospinota bacterium]
MEALDPKQFLDLRGETCPMTWVRTKLALDRLPAGTRLRVMLDRGQPALEVPRNAKMEGYEIEEAKWEADNLFLTLRK